MKSGNLNFLEPSGPLQACNGSTAAAAANETQELPLTDLFDSVLKVKLIQFIEVLKSYR
jgi:hypothetical protein